MQSLRDRGKIAPGGVFHCNARRVVDESIQELIHVVAQVLALPPGAVKVKVNREAPLMSIPEFSLPPPPTPEVAQRIEMSLGAIVPRWRNALAERLKAWG